MPTPSDDSDRADRLVDLIEARQQWLGDEWTTIAERGDINYQPVYRVRTRRGTPTAKTKRGLETGLFWPRGILDDIPTGAAADELITLPRTAADEPPELGDAALRAAWRKIRDGRGRAVADQWLRDTVALLDNPGNSTTQGNSA